MLPARHRPGAKSKVRKRLKPRVVSKKSKKDSVSPLTEQGENEGVADPAASPGGQRSESGDADQLTIDNGTVEPVEQQENVDAQVANSERPETTTEIPDQQAPNPVPPGLAPIRAPRESEHDVSAATSPATIRTPLSESVSLGRAKSKRKESPHPPTEEERSQMLMKDFLRNSVHGVPMPSTARAKRIRKAKRDKQKDSNNSEVAEPRSPVDDAANESQSVAGEQGTDEAEEPATHPRAPQVQLGPDGQIIINTESIVYRPEIEHHGLETLAQTTEDASRITSATYSKRAPSERWSTEETKKFYRALRQCGTDFTMISTLFPNRNRRQIRNKFKREEKAQPELVMNVLNPKVALPIDLGNFEGALGKSLVPMPLIEDATSII